MTLREDTTRRPPRTVRAFNIKPLNKLANAWMFRRNPQFGDPRMLIPSEDSFYFRISGANVYYTETEADLKVLGAISVKNIKSTDHSDLEKDCFTINNSEIDEWHLCASSEEEMNQWFCAINAAMGKPCAEEKPTMIVKEIQKVEQPMMIINIPSEYCNTGWGYFNEGQDWECKCTEGHMQSPIDLPRQKITTPVNDAAIFDYYKQKAGTTSYAWEDGKVKIKGKFGTLNDVDLAEYEAHEIQIHTPSEHRLDGKQYDLEIQVHHKSITKGDEAKKAVLSILFEKKYGATNKFFEDIDLLNLPDRYNSNAVIDQQVDINDIFNSSDGSMSANFFSYYYYHGSLTAPPCDEKVQWFVVSEPIALGSTAIDMIRDTINVRVKVPKDKTTDVILDNDRKMLDGNSRKVQQLNDRTVYFFDKSRTCEWDEVKPVEKPSGHYEKVQNDVFKYIQVSGNEPSGLKDSYIVTE